MKFSEIHFKSRFCDMLEYLGIICKSIILEFNVFVSFLWGWKQVDLVIILCQFNVLI